MSSAMKFDDTLGPLLLGGMFAMALWGITCVQTYTYFSRPRKDRPIFRLIIACLWAIDTFDTSLNIHLTYHYMVSNFMNFSALLIPVWSVILHVAITATSNFIIRTLFAYRIFNLSKGNILVTAWIMAISTTDLVTGIIITAKAYQLDNFLQLDTLSHLMYLTFAAGTGADLSVAIALVWLLRRSRTGFRKTDGLIKTLMLYTINTGLIVAIDAALGMILYVVMPRNFIFLGFYLLLSKLYLNSYLATMNARQDLRDKINEPVSIHLSEIQSGSHRFGSEELSPSMSEKSQQSTRPELSISIQTLVDKQVDSPIAQRQSRDNLSYHTGRAY
ncbi:hypothetical protein CC1G_09783 [Coprinopsis cinerea okayama7|uniref:DUF6534 domain-containing protein n=1 Tax=Coprinopsis cinerea (strain Okayama-7 / 130 / ATCC MYA-4618 / FGSC 9003) TaxID=240176 RepID=A8NM72_COPC7|nr:hypothetical protein CC1G_09783 [Coprinopsis cinerea okayama7\|eukprot:XP_001834856.2 hypothetical protein CC1G_09783 [Coprinopsis cinerea okayama7\